jgi:flagellar protein FlaI
MKSAKPLRSKEAAASDTPIHRVRPIPFNPPETARIIHFYEVPLEVETTRTGHMVFILEDGGRGLYYVKEPNAEPELLEKLSSIIEELTRYGMIEYVELQHPIEAILARTGRMEGKVLGALLYYAHRSIVGYGLLEPLLRDPEVEDVSCEGVGRPLKVWHRRFNQYEWLETNVSFDSQDELDALVAKMAYRAGRAISTSTPLLDAHLPEGHRISASWQSEVSPHGSSFTVRKFREGSYTITELFSLGTISPELAAYLWTIMDLKGFTIIAGVTASGKTTLLNALATLLNPNGKIVSIEDVRELQLPHTGWKPLVTRPMSLGSPNNIDMELLTRFALRERPDYIILGEGRGVEVRTLFQSAATGHGVTTTFHAPNPEGFAARITSPPISLEKGMLSIIDCVVFIEKVREDAKLIRRVTSIGDFRTGGWSCTHRWDGNWWTATEYLHQALKERGDFKRISHRQLEHTLEERSRFLQDLQRRKVYSYTELSAELRRFYSATQIHA